MRPACPHAILMLLITLLIAGALGADDAAPQVQNGAALPLLLAAGGILVAAGAVILWLSLRIVRAFMESSAALISTLRALTPMPVVTLSENIPAGAAGLLDVRIEGFSSLPIGNVTVMLSPMAGLGLEEDHIVLPCLDPGETRLFRIGFRPVAEGIYPVRITVLYTAGGEERLQEFTRTVRARAPDPEQPGFPQE